jgi:DNA-directed RNA polymerase sigma subunit (sigma70/sigma32)
MVERGQAQKRLETTRQLYQSIDPDSIFKPRRKRILEERLGLFDGVVKTVQEVAALYNTSEDTVRYVERSTIRQMRRVSQGLPIRRI